MKTSPPDLMRLYVDEDVWRALAPELRRRGYDALSVYDVGREGKTDPEQLAYAVTHKRTMLTFNRGDYLRLALEYARVGQVHYGIVVSDQLLQGELLRRVLNLLQSRTAEQVYNVTLFLSSFR